MKNTIWLIFRENKDVDEEVHIVGYVQGTEEEARQYCNRFNKYFKYDWQYVRYVELVNLLEAER